MPRKSNDGATAASPSDTSITTAGRLAALFRKLHTLKGVARSVGMLQLARTIHDAEEVVTGWRSNHLVLNRQDLGKLCRTLSDLEDNVQDSRATPDTCEEIWEMLGDCRTLALELQPSERSEVSGKDAELARQVGALFRHLHSFKGLAKLSELRELVETAHCTEEEVRAWSGPGGRPDMPGALQVRKMLRRLRGSVEHLDGPHAQVAEELTGLLEESLEALAGIEILAALEDPVAPLLRTLQTLKAQAKLEGFRDLSDRVGAIEDLVEMWLGRSNAISKISVQTVRAELRGAYMAIGALKVLPSQMEMVSELEALVERSSDLLGRLVS